MAEVLSKRSQTAQTPQTSRPCVSAKTNAAATARHTQRPNVTHVPSTWASFAGLFKPNRTSRGQIATPRATSAMDLLAYAPAALGLGKQVLQPVNSDGTQSGVGVGATPGPGPGPGPATCASVMPAAAAVGRGVVHSVGGLATQAGTLMSSCHARQVPAAARDAPWPARTKHARCDRGSASPLG